MAVIYFKEVTGRDGSDDADTNTQRTRTFEALTDHPLDGSDRVLAYPDVPALRSIFTYVDGLGITRFDAKSVCVRRRAVQDNQDHHQKWVITCEYVGLDDPFAQPPEVDYEPVPYQRAKLKDTTGRPYKNSAGDPFEGGHTVDDSRFVLTITQNVEADAWSPQIGELFKDSLNAFPFLVVRHPPGLAAGTCKLLMSAKLVWYPNRVDYYWRRTAKIDYKAEGWAGRLRDAGYNVKLAGGLFGGVPVPYFAPNGARPTSPVLLDLNGFKLAAGLDPLELPPFADYVSRDWFTLNLEY